MKNKYFLILLISMIISSSLFALEVDIPTEIPAYRNLMVKLIPTQSEGTISEARFFFYQAGVREPLYSEFMPERDEWIAKVPYTYLTGEELTYFSVMKNTEGTVYRTPQIGTEKVRLIQDITPPTLKLVSPTTFDLVAEEQQLVVFEIEDESALSSFSITIDGQEAIHSGAFGQYLSFLVKPTGQEESVVSVSMKDRYENTSTEEYRFKIGARKAPVFVADASYQSSIELEYILGLGESEKTLDVPTVFADQNHQLNVSYELGGDTYLKAGPISLQVAASLSDSISVEEIFEAYPNTLLADLQNILNLYNPLNFANEFDYTGEIARKYENDNRLLLKISFFDPIITYTFGDQELNFQPETINKLGFRGTALAIDLPFFEMKVGKGLTDLGLYQVAWPKNFLGFQVGVKAKELWYFQTNLSFISALQGRYTSLKKTGATSQIGELYDVLTTPPDQNMVMGLGTGVHAKTFTIDASFSFSLYNQDASTILDVNQLASDLESQGGPDLSSYIDYIDTVHAIFPVLDYFLPSNGLIAGIIDKDLWGISYGVDMTIPSLGMEAWVRKTDAAFRSLGSSVETDIFTFGVFSEKSVGDFMVRGGYSYDKDTIADILFNDIIALVKPDLLSTSTVSASDISTILHTAQVGFDTPQSKLLGTVSVNYSFTFATNTAEKLAEKAPDSTVESSILTSTKNDVTMTHTAELRWRSGQYKLGQISTNVGAQTKDSYVLQSRIDGVDSDTSFFEYSYALTNSLGFDRYVLSLGFDQAWSTEDDSLITYGYDTSLSIKDTFFNTVRISASLDQAFKSSLEAYRISGGFELDKQFGMFVASASLKTEYYDSLLDNTEDSLTTSLTIKGIFRK